MKRLAGFQARRSGAVVVVEWKGSPRFTIGVWGQASDAEAFEQAAKSIEKGEREGIDPEELLTCAFELRTKIQR